MVTVPRVRRYVPLDTPTVRPIGEKMGPRAGPVSVTRADAGPGVCRRSTAAPGRGWPGCPQ